MSNRIITISREFGSGGRTIGKMAAEKLGIPCYDRELIEKIAQESGLSEEYIKEQSEYTASSSWLTEALLSYHSNGPSIQDQIWAIQQQTIIELAQKEPCVIVGRCADYILQGQHDILSVYIHAPLEVRAKRIVDVYGETTESPEKRIKEKDKRRRAYYKIYTDMEWGKPENYDVCINSASFGLEKCADMIAGLY